MECDGAILVNLGDFVNPPTLFWSYGGQTRLHRSKSKYFIVIPAKAGIQSNDRLRTITQLRWIPNQVGDDVVRGVNLYKLKGAVTQLIGTHNKAMDELGCSFHEKHKGATFPHADALLER
jgi:hypothetical protein